MISEPYPSLITISDRSHDGLASLWRQVRGMLILSLVGHLGVLGLLMGVRLATTVERPLASYQVSLVTVPKPAAKPRAVSPPPVPPTPIALPVQEQAPPPIPVKEARVAEPQPASPLRLPVVPTDPLSAPSRTSKSNVQATLQEALRGIELPPEVPKFQEVKPEPPQATTPSTPRQKDLQQMVGKLTVPEAPVRPQSSRPPVPPTPTVPPQARPTLSRDLAKQLEQLERVLPPPPRPTTVEPPPATPPVPKAPPQTASVPDLANPGARLQVQGVAPGFSEYLARVQNEISKQWVAPAVDTEGRVLEVVIKFRLHRSGAVSGVVVERSSGNDYYDLAGKRAILASYPLPPFPPEMRNGYVDAHFSFIVGKQNG